MDSTGQPASPATPAQPADPQTASPTVIVQTGRAGLLFRIFAWLGWSSCFVLLVILIGQALTMSEYFDTTGGIMEKFHSGEPFAATKVAIINGSGVIMQGDGYVKQQIDRVRDDKNVKAVVLRVDSPGGTVTGSDYIFHHLTKLREDKEIPVVVSMGSIATSGGYYVSMAVGHEKQTIYAEPTTTTGSIGVIIPHYDISGLLEEFNVKDDSIATHPRKQMLSMTRPISEDHRRLLEGYVDESFSRFKDIVKLGRANFDADPEALDQLATGEIFTANQAKRFGLVDEIGFIEAAIDRATELAQLDSKKVRVVEYEQPPSLFNVPSLMQSRASEIETLLDMSTPRAYYITTTLPPIVTSWLRRP